MWENVKWFVKIENLIIIILNMELEGAVDEIIFRNEENGYSVFSFDAEDRRIVAVGTFLAINVGENLKLVGEYKFNNRFGKQFQVESYECVEPKTTKGIEKYLSSGLIRGVGPVTAEAIVKKFKGNTLEIIEFNPEKLVEIKGISKKKAELISESLIEVKYMQNAMVFLQGYNISTLTAVKIYDIYKNQTIEVVKNNPYRLIEDVTGIGFSKADLIAQNLGIEKNSPFRIRAGILHVLNEASDKNGHTYLLNNGLEDEVIKLLGLENDNVKNIYQNVVEVLQKENLIKIFWVEGHEVAMLSKMYSAEKAVASKLAILNNSNIISNLNLDDEIKLFEQSKKIQFHEEQKNAIKMAINKGVSVITGGPGTGKTTIISCVLQILKTIEQSVLLLAPTGRASKRLSESTGEIAKTIHRALEIDFRSKNNLFVYNEKNPLPYNAIIVDEVSMCDVLLMNSLLKAMAKGTKLIMVGDKDQLPSVGAGNVLADVLASETIEVTYLTKIYRQEKDSLIISNAHMINEGIMPVLDNKSLDFFFESKEEKSEIFESIVSLVTERIPNFFKIDVSKIQVLGPLKSGECGIENINEKLQEKINVPSSKKIEIKVGQTIFREGDKVMQTSNNYNLEWRKYLNKYGEYEEGAGVFNGDIGYIYKINPQNFEVTVWFEDGREAVYPRSDASQLSLAYAITIHKSQGSEFDAVVIPIYTGPSIIFNRNLIYTAVTRAKKLVVLVGSKIALKKMISNKFMAKRFTLLKQFLIDENKKFNDLFNN